MKTLTVTEAARNFSDFVSRIHYRGESALLVKGGKPMVKVVPARVAKTGHELAGIWPGISHLSVAEADALGRDLDAARVKLPPVRSTWE